MKPEITLNGDEVVDHFVHSVGSGQTHLSHIQKVAEALHQKHPDDPSYAFFAGQRRERDFHRNLKFAYKCHLEPYVITVKLRDKADTQLVNDVELATLAPYEVFAEMYRLGEPFHEFVMGRKPGEDCAEFWDTLSASRPVTPLVMGNKDKCCPLYFHTDGGEANEMCSDHAVHAASLAERKTVEQC